MSTRNTAKDYEFWHGAREYPVESFDHSLEYDKSGATDSSTDPEGKESSIGRGVRRSKINTLLYNLEGTEVTTGTLQAKVKYLVTAGTITEGSNTYPVGTIFVSNGTGTASTTNKVKPLGSYITGKTASCSVNSTTVPVTSFKYNCNYDEIDSTDSSSDPDTKEFSTGRAERTSSIEMIQRKEDADLLIGAPAAVPVVLTLAPGMTITGNAKFIKKGGLTAASKSDNVKVNYDLEWQGVPTMAGFNLIPVNLVGSIKQIYAKGSSTNKAYSGNGIITGYEISIDVAKADTAKVAYNLVYTGTVTETVAS